MNLSSNHRVVLDTNLFISGLLFGGKVERILDAWINNSFILYFSPQLKAEVVMKLADPFHYPPEKLQELETLIDHKTQWVFPVAKATICRDPKDNFLLDLAEAAQAMYLVSGDKDLLSLQTYKNTVIISPKEFLHILSS